MATIVAVLMVGILTVSAAPSPYSNTNPIAIPLGGIATPYPSTIVVSGVSGLLTDVNVTLLNVTHSFPDDLDILLVGPSGATVILMSDVGGGNGVSNLTLTLDDVAASSLPNSTAFATGTFKPTDFTTGDPFPFPAPAGPYGATLSVFNGTDPNGTWSLYVVDDVTGDSGSIGGGWSLEFNATPIATNESPTVTVPDNIIVGNDSGQSGAVVTFGATATDPEDGDLTPDCTPASGSFFPIGTTTVECTATDSADNTGNASFTVTVNDVDQPTLTVPSDITVNATSPKGTVVTFTTTATDNTGTTTVVCTPPSGSTFAVGTTTVTCTATDAANNQVSESFTVTVIGANDLLQNLRTMTIDLVNNSSAEKSLVATVDRMIQAAAKGDLRGYYSALIIFTMQLDGYESKRVISASVAHQLLAQARLAQDAMF